MELMSLPVVMIEHILSFLSYDEIAKSRIVCKEFDALCQRMLNRGFLMIERRHMLSLKSVKAQLPRRESERRYHPLARHCDILTSIETRISMLNMTYSKYIDHSICCFIPGKVIDEIQRVLRIVEKSVTPPRAHEVLQELRDISSMAIEHFDDKISPAFRRRLQEGAAVNAIATQQKMFDVAHSDSNLLAGNIWRHQFAQLQKKFILNSRVTVHLYKLYGNITKKLSAHRQTIIRQRRVIKTLTTKQNEQDSAIADLKRRIEECDIKYSELTHTNQAVGGKAIAGGDATSSSSQPLRNFASQIKLDLSVLPIGTGKNKEKGAPNIKPRNSKIRLPSLSSDDPIPSPPKQPKLSPRVTKPALKPSTSKQPAGPRKSTLHESINQLRSIAKSFKSIAGSTSEELMADEEKELSMLGKRKKVAGLLDESMLLTKKYKLD